MVGIFIIMFLFVKLSRRACRACRQARIAASGWAPGGYHHGSKVARIGA